MRIRLPTGDILAAATDPTQDPPSDCSRVFGFLPVVASYLASVECQVRLLQLVGPLTDIVKALDGTPQLAANAAKFLAAAEALAPCELSARAAGAVPFLRDLLCLALRAVTCILGQLKTLVALMTTLATQLHAAHAAGNTDLVRALETAQKNAQARVSNVLPSIEAVQSVLDLASVFFEISGIEAVRLPSAPSNAELDTLVQLTESLTSSAASLQIAVDALGGCDE